MMTNPRSVRVAGVFLCRCFGCPRPPHPLLPAKIAISGAEGWRLRRGGVGEGLVVQGGADPPPGLGSSVGGRFLAGWFVSQSGGDFGVGGLIGGWGRGLWGWLGVVG